MYIGSVLAIAGGVAMVATRDRQQSLLLPPVPIASSENEDGRLHDDMKPTVPFAQSPEADTSALVPIKTTRFHIVQPGETLSSIAKRYYGTTTAVGKILEANRGVLDNPDRIRPGTKLIIPD